MSKVTLPSSKNYYSNKKLLFLLVLIFLIPKNIWNAPGVGLDSSWELSLNLAIKHHLVWGKDIVFTYGPLGYFSTLIPQYTSALLIALYTLFICICAIYFIYSIFKIHLQKNELIFITIFLFFHGHFLFLRDSVSLYFYALFFILHFIKYNKHSSVIFVITCCIIAFFMKVNTGLILIFIFFTFLLFCYITSLLSLKACVSYTLCFISLLLLLSIWLNVDLVSYIVNSIPIIDAYNDAMGTFPEQILLFYASVIILLTILPFLMNIKRIFTSLSDLFLFIHILLFLFILSKQSFVRYDGDLHTNLFFICSPFVVLITYLFSRSGSVKNFLYYTFLVACMISLAGFSGSHKKYIKGNIQITNEFQQPIPASVPSDESLKISSKIKKRTLPDRMLREIGNKSVDLLGYETSYIYYNNLNYNPRPVFQSYSAYDPKLIRLNTEKYESPTAPEYVLYHIGSLDERHPFWDESPIYLSLFKRYTIVDSFYTKKMSINAFDWQNKIRNQLFLFKKQNNVKHLSKKVVLDTVVQMNSEIRIPKSDRILFMEMESELTLIGNVVRVLFQPSHVSMNLKYADGDSTVCRLILPVMKSGVPINKKVLNPHEAYLFFQTKGIDNISATSFSIHGNPFFTKDSFRLKFIEHNIPD